MTDTLFPLPEANERQTEAVNAERRVQRPNRAQLELRPVDLRACCRQILQLDVTRFFLA